MVMWTFWSIFILITIVMFETVFIFANWSAIKFNFAMFFGTKKLYLWKEGSRITNWVLVKEEPDLGIEFKKKTYSADEKKGIFYKRMQCHIFDNDNVAELDFSDKKGLYCPEKLDPGVHNRAIKRALASGVNDINWMKIMIVVAVIGVAIAIGLFAGIYFNYQTYEWMRDYLVQSGVIKI